MTSNNSRRRGDEYDDDDTDNDEPVQRVASGGRGDEPAAAKFVTERAGTAAPATATASATSTGSPRTGSLWNMYQHELAGKGFKKTIVSRGYKAGVRIFMLREREKSTAWHSFEHELAGNRLTATDLKQLYHAAKAVMVLGVADEADEDSAPDRIRTKYEALVESPTFAATLPDKMPDEAAFAELRLAVYCYTCRVAVLEEKTANDIWNGVKQKLSDAQLSAPIDVKKLLCDAAKHMLLEPEDSQWIPDAWNRFQKAVKGHGFTPTERSALYRAAQDIIWVSGANDKPWSKYQSALKGQGFTSEKISPAYHAALKLRDEANTATDA